MAHYIIKVRSLKNELVAKSLEYGGLEGYSDVEHRHLTTILNQIGKVGSGCRRTVKENHSLIRTGIVSQKRTVDLCSLSRYSSKWIVVRFKSGQRKSLYIQLG